MLRLKQDLIKNMKNKAAVILCIILVIANIILLGYNCKSSKSESYNKELLHLNGLNDSLNKISKELKLEIDSLRKQSIKSDSVITEIKVAYEKEFIDIVNQPISADVKFFTEYLSENCAGFSDSDYSATTEKD